MTDARWLLVVRFMFWALYRLNRATGLPGDCWGGSGTLEYELESEVRRLQELLDRQKL